MADRVMFGDLDSASGSIAAAERSYFKYIPAYSGVVVSISVLAAASGNVKIGLYSDLTDYPRDRITLVGSIAVTGGTRTLVVLTPPVFVAAGTPIWVGIVGDVTGAVRYSAGTSVRKYGAVTYSSYVFPSTAESSLSSDTKDGCLAGYESQSSFGVTLGYSATAASASYSSLTAGRHYLGRVYCETSGVLTKIAHRTTGGSSNAKYSIYSDDAGRPGVLLYADPVEDYMPSSGWGPAAVGGGLILMAGSYYWVGVNVETGSSLVRASGGTGYYKAAAYAGFVPPATISGYISEAYTLKVAVNGSPVSVDHEVTDPADITLEMKPAKAYFIPAPTHNPRGAVRPVDKALGVVIAENFLGPVPIIGNGAILIGDPLPTINRGAVFDGDNSLTIANHRIPRDGFSASAKVRFDSVPESGIIFGSADFRAGISAPGFCVWVADGIVTAGVRDTSSHSGSVAMVEAVTAGEDHIVTLDVSTAGAIRLRVGDQEASGTISGFTAPGPAAGALIVGGGIVGTVNAVRVYREELDPAEHGAGYADPPAPLVEYRLRDFGHDAAAGVTWSRQGAGYDLTLGDGADPDTAPEFLDPGYSFDGADDHFSGWPTLDNDTLTTGILRSEGGDVEVVFDTDGSGQTTLTTPGGYTGTVFRMAVWEGELTPRQQEAIRELWTRKYPLSGAIGIDRRLIAESNLVFYHRYSDGNANGIGGLGHPGAETDIDYVDGGADFPLGTSNVCVSDAADLRLSEGTIAAVASITTGGRVLVGKGSNYSLEIAYGQGRFVGDSDIAIFALPDGLDITAAHHYAVTFRTGAPATLYVDGVSMGVTLTKFAGDPLDESDLYVGGGSSDPGTAIIDRVQIFNEELTAAEIVALYHRARGMT